jgi:hypothetical protein
MLRKTAFSGLEKQIFLGRTPRVSIGNQFAPSALDCMYLPFFSFLAEALSCKLFQILNNYIVFLPGFQKGRNIEAS